MCVLSWNNPIRSSSIWSDFQSGAGDQSATSRPIIASMHGYSSKIWFQHNAKSTVVSNLNLFNSFFPRRCHHHFFVTSSTRTMRLDEFWRQIPRSKGQLLSYLCLSVINETTRMKLYSPFSTTITERFAKTPVRRFWRSIDRHAYVRLHRNIAGYCWGWTTLVMTSKMSTF